MSRSCFGTGEKRDGGAKIGGVESLGKSLTGGAQPVEAFGTIENAIEPGGSDRRPQLERQRPG